MVQFKINLNLSCIRAQLCTLFDFHLLFKYTSVEARAYAAGFFSLILYAYILEGFIHTCITSDFFLPLMVGQLSYDGFSHLIYIAK